MLRVLEFCFTHERMRVEGDTYLQLEKGIVTTLAFAGYNMKHKPCDLCPDAEERDAVQLRLFGRD